MLRGDTDPLLAVAHDPQYAITRDASTVEDRSTDRPVKVMHLITGLLRGGAEAQLVQLATRMDRSRVASVVVSLIDEGSLGADLHQSGVPLHTLGMSRGFPSPAAVLALRRLIRKERPDLLQTWLYHADLLGLAVRLSLSPRVPLVWNVRCSDLNLAQHSPRTGQVRSLLAQASRSPTAIIVNSEAGQRYHAALGYRPRRWELVPNGIDTRTFRPDEGARRRWRTRLGVGEDQLLVGMVGRVHPMKDHATALAALAEVSRARPNAVFLLVGRGTERLQWPCDLAHRLHVLGERADVAEILPALDLHILSSAFGEGFPNVLGEAMACGVPCITTDVGDSALIVGDTGDVVPRCDPQALAAAIIRFVDLAGEARARAGQAARARIVACYDVGKVLQRYQQLYEEIVTA